MPSHSSWIAGCKTLARCALSAASALVTSPPHLQEMIHQHKEWHRFSKPPGLSVASFGLVFQVGLQPSKLLRLPDAASCCQDSPTFRQRPLAVGSWHREAGELAMHQRLLPSSPEATSPTWASAALVAAGAPLLQHFASHPLAPEAPPPPAASSGLGPQQESLEALPLDEAALEALLPAVA